eukprot:Trichotokara_eunicae@DN10502_c0_g1_i1.p1
MTEDDSSPSVSGGGDQRPASTSWIDWTPKPFSVGSSCDDFVHSGCAHCGDEIGTSNVSLFKQTDSRSLKDSSLFIFEETCPPDIQNYVKVVQVGQGAYGDVWLAEDLVNRR